ncbi:MAG: PorP/SprF family type IX secretion system membrane protein [Saprospiraceae bacterium]
MRFKTLLLILTIIATVNTVKAQDFHYTQFDMSPLTLNPALTGAFEGTFRVGGIYRDQWESVLGSNSFRTPSIYIDAPIIRGFSKKHWVGVGVSFLNDQVGAYKYQNTLGGLSLAYHIGIGEKTTISLGGQYSQVQRRFDRSALQLAGDYDWVTDSFAPGGASEGSLQSNVNFGDIGAGLSFSTAAGTNDKVRIKAGVGAAHLNAPVPGMNTATEAEALPIRITGHANVDIDLTERWVLSPGVMYQTMAGAQEINAVAMIGYRLKDNFLLQYGQGLRFGDATNAIIAVQYNRLRAGISYDINISSLNNITSSQGGFELGVSYIAHIFTEPKSKPVIFCPRF